MPADPNLIPQILQRWADKQLKLHRDAFRVGGHQRHGGDRWAPLAASTIEAKGGLATPLVKTGALSRSIFAKVSGTTVLISSDSSYAVYHQNGTTTIPQREVVFVSKRDKEQLKADIKRTLES